MRRVATLNGHLPDPQAELSIAVDFDGVLFDQVPHIIEGFERMHGVDLRPVDDWHWDLTRHDAIREAGLSDEQVWAVFQALEVEEAIHRDGLLEPRSIGVMASWRDAGHTVEVVTSRRERAREVTEGFLEAHGVPYDQLHMAVDRKTDHDLLIDDLPFNVTNAAQAGSLALLMDQPYNRSFPADGNPFRVHGWSEIARVLEVLSPG